MNDTRSSVPHFLRVARALAGVHRVALPLAITTVVVSVYAGCSDGAALGKVVMPDSGGGGSSSSSGYGGEENGLTLMDAGYDGAATGRMTMPDSGPETGLVVMPDAGSDGG